MGKIESDELLSRCKNLFYQFEGLHNLATYGRKGVEMTDSWIELIDYRKFADTEMQGDEDLKLLSFLDDAFGVAFAFGFVIGHTVNSTNPDDQLTLNTIQEIIHKNQLLPYLPRERGTRP